MKLNIVVPNYNRAELLARTLKSLAAATVSPNLEIVVTVVDNNSIDETPKIVENLRPRFGKIKLEYIFEPRQGKSYALDTGIERADGDILSGVDDDVAIAAENQPAVFAGYFYGRNLQNSRFDKFLRFFGSRIFESANR